MKQGWVSRQVGSCESETDLDDLLKLEPGFVGILFASWVGRWQDAGISKLKLLFSLFVQPPVLPS